jgi:hypothetical protein
MSLRRRLPLVIATFALVLAAAGCGGGASEDEYEQGLAKVQSQLEDANDASREASGTADAAARAEALTKAQAAIDRAADTAEGLEPPDDATSEHEQLAEALRDYAKLFGELATLEEDDPRQTELYGEAGKIVERLDSAKRALDEAGYQVPRKDDE